MKEESIPYPKTWTLRWFILMFKIMCEYAWHYLNFLVIVLKKIGGKMIESFLILVVIGLILLALIIHGGWN